MNTSFLSLYISIKQKEFQETPNLYSIEIKELKGRLSQQQAAFLKEKEGDKSVLTTPTLFKSYSSLN